MRLAALALITTLTIGCGGPEPEALPELPQYERSYYKPLERPPAVFASMDLPYYGGQVERATDTYMQVSYGREATVEQLVEWWPPAMRAAGWTPTEERAKDNGGFVGQYTLPDGGTASLSINPEGMLWMVDLSAYPAE